MPTRVTGLILLTALHRYQQDRRKARETVRYVFYQERSCRVVQDLGDGNLKILVGTHKTCVVHESETTTRQAELTSDFGLRSHSSQIRRGKRLKPTSLMTCAT